jgi:dolichol-phosphate mannosyltransferase
LEKLYEVLYENIDKFEIICVNDCSTDESIARIKAFASNVSNCVLSIVNMSIYQGRELSINAGVDISIGDFVFEFDSINIDYPINTIMDVYYHSLKGFDIVSASPEDIKQISSRLFYKIFNYHNNSPYPLRTENFRILSRRAINRVHSLSKTIPYRKAVYANCGLKIASIIYKQTDSSHTNTKDSYQFSELRKSVAIDSLILFTEVAYKISRTLTFLFLAFTIFAGGYTLIVYLSGCKPITGWTTTMIFLSVAFFGVFLVLAIIIKYLSTLVNLVFKKQKYLIESVEKITK